ncbi:hypothetical protein D9M68_902180 [compost metagenome]
MIAGDETVAVRHIEHHRTGGFNLPAEDARGDQHVAHAAMGDGHAARRAAAAAAEFGGDEQLALLLRRRVVHAHRVQLQHAHGIGRGEGTHQRLAGFLLAFVRQHVAGGEGQEVQGPAA